MTLTKITLYIRDLLVVLAVAMIASCTPDDFEGDLGPLPDPSFSVTPLASNPNYIIVKNTTANSFLQEWDFGRDNLKSKDAVDTIHYAYKGEYTITLTAFGAGGFKKLAQKVNIANDDPCSDETMTKLAGPCGEDGKVWVLKQPDGGALWVGSLTGDTWWSNGAAEVYDEKRVCMFNDEYKFTRDGKFYFDNKGDMRVDDEGGNPWPSDIGLAIGCHDMSAIPQKYHAWGSGTHTFELTPNSIKVMGEGAFLGLYKVGEGGTTASPEQQVTYEIVELTSSKLKVRKAYSWGAWVFEFVPKGQIVEGTNVIVGGGMDDASKWTVSNAGVTQTQAEFVNGGLKFSNGTATAQTNVMVWQAVQVEAKTYRFSADVKGSGATNSWLEVFFGASAPVNGSDYNENLYTGLNTWDQCGNAPFEGNLAVLGCKKVDGQPAPGAGKNGAITFSSTGTIYLVFKAGSWDGNLGQDGFTLDNVKLVEMP